MVPAKLMLSARGRQRHHGRRHLQVPVLSVNSSVPSIHARVPDPAGGRDTICVAPWIGSSTCRDSARQQQLVFLLCLGGDDHGLCRPGRAWICHSHDGFLCAVCPDIHPATALYSRMGTAIRRNPAGHCCRGPRTTTSRAWPQPGNTALRFDGFIKSGLAGPPVTTLQRIGGLPPPLALLAEGFPRDGATSSRRRQPQRRCGQRRARFRSSPLPRRTEGTPS